MLRTEDLDFDLPEDLIATHPAERRDGSRLLVVSRSDPGLLQDRSFADLPSLVSPGDCMVFNRSAVVMARFVGSTLQTGGRIGGMYLADADEKDCFVALVKARRIRIGNTLVIEPESPERDPVSVEIVGQAEGGGWVLRVLDGIGVAGFLDRCGRPPLPPYILSARVRAGEPEVSAEDSERYQTVYAREQGSVAAPTAGLHFTPSMMTELDRAGVVRQEVVLHVGRGTFLPVETESVEAHPMHSEWCAIDAACEQSVAEAKSSGSRVIGVGTTSARTLESFAISREQGKQDRSHETDILITPGYQWRWVDGLVTNFHLPRSTLLAMIASLLEEAPGTGLDRVLRIYRHAVENRYRFFSYGDAMLILP